MNPEYLCPVHGHVTVVDGASDGTVRCGAKFSDASGRSCGLRVEAVPPVPLNPSGLSVYEGIDPRDGRLHCSRHPDVFCECISDFMHKNGDAPLTPGGIWVPMFRAINVPDGTGGWVTDLPFHVEMILLTRDENGVAEATYKGRGGGVRPLCLVGPNDGRYAIRTAILIDLRSLVERGQPTCDGNFHDGRYDRDYGYEVQYTTTNLHRARLLDTYSRTYLGSCWPCLQRESNHDLGNLAAL